MTEAATFVIDQQTGRIEVMLGKHVVATIHSRKDGARYRLKLPGQNCERHIESIGKARRLVLHVLADWVEAAGPAFAQAAETLAAQAELEREAA